MSNRIQNIVERINRLQDELEAALSEKAEKFSYSIVNRRIKFQSETLKRQKQFRQVLWQYIAKARLKNVLTMPVIYSLIVPFVLLDIFVSLYQAICFPAYGIPKVRRRDYIVIDRHHLAYLNILEKLNCAYCGYGNGLLAYSLEIAARTEAFWCPVKHANKMGAYHGWYGDFSDFGDAENYHADRKRNIDSVRKGKDVAADRPKNVIPD